MPDSPETIKLTLEDLKTCEVDAVLANVTEHGYMARHSALTEAAGDPGSTLTGTQRNALRFFAAICSMMLSSVKQDDPFGAMIILHDRRSMLAGDLTSEELSLLENFLPTVKDLWLKGRIAHLLWLNHTPKDYQHALEAIDHYSAIPLTIESWIRDGHSTWSQAVVLAKTLGTTTLAQLQRLESELVSAALGFTPDAQDMILYVEPLLRDHRLGLSQSSDVAIELVRIGASLFADNSFIDAGNCFQRAQWWFAEADMDGDRNKAAVREADSYIAEGEQRASADQPSYMAAAHWYEDALRTLRSIPHAARDTLNVDDQIDKVRQQHADAVDKARHEFVEISSPSIDLTDIVDGIRTELSDKPTIEALAIFLNMIQPPDVDQYRKRATEQVGKPSIRHLVSGVYQSVDGRTVGLRPSVDPLLPEAEQERFILSEMLFEYEFFVGLCSAQILIGLDSMHAEHRLTHQDFVNLSESSPLVPRGRVYQWAKALHFGYEKDFIASLHVLVPQVEHLIRDMLAARGLETSTIHESGIHRHKSLENLLALPGAEKLIDPTLRFELQALLCDPFREGLRNEVAHGLLADDQVVSQTSIYVWWMFFKLVFNPVWLSRHDPVEAEAESPPSEQNCD